MTKTNTTKDVLNGQIQYAQRLLKQMTEHNLEMLQSIKPVKTTAFSTEEMKACIARRQELKQSYLKQLSTLFEKKAGKAKTCKNILSSQQTKRISKHVEEDVSAGV